jgi:hypothetical protein
MRFSRHFELGFVQAQLDFVDIELTADQALFLDPYALQVRADLWSVECTRIIRIYFQSLIDAIRENDNAAATHLLSALHEPWETRLGKSRRHFHGSGIGSYLARDLYNALRKSEAVQTGFLKDLADTELFIPQVSDDRISDLTTNIIRGQLITYTQQQCRLHGVSMISVPSGPIWDPETREWMEDYVHLPVNNGSKILLVPKMAVRWRTSLASDEYYSDFVVEYIRANEFAKPGSQLVKVLKSGERRPANKQTIKEAFPSTKEWLLKFSKDNPAVLESYKEFKAKAKPVADAELDGGFDERLFAQALINQLTAIPTGPESATQYHRFMACTLEFLFFPALTHPTIEHEINSGQKRIDLTFINADREGFFYPFPNITRRNAQLIIVEFKNYSRDLNNPEVDQIGQRFADHRGWLGLLVCRHNDDPEALLARCRTNASERHGYILPLDDRNIIAMLRLVASGQRDMVTGHLDLILRELTR